ncbi:ABC-type glycerol-3-phosphate transport system, substrate-binding protein [Paenibacillus sp. UNCCL117]|uniref:extracellular solute-binding protein n=1 Tax=unclassified Paenibacillus TaxID=185978 RepID=UPI000884623D|nr:MULTISPECIES: extracellular solute-binding protein [unclassified Paenibacillus]SDC54984.1 ABC-type glycerol-3-phosphate transport system, substrate-binding protein [Paenibacillus sp. cl123]SFW10981.1 ABC-type glycerol-3-phosphate transport system, substrate-binding protein [Paenibacillus sp. UNCCL117]
MENKRKVGAIAGATLLAVFAAGCSTGPDSSGGSNGGAASGKNEPVTLTMFNRVNAQIAVDNNPVLAEAGRLANVKLSLEAPPINNYNDKLQVLMASGDLPDLIYNWGGADSNMETWAKNGLLTPLDDKIAQYPNLTKNITKEMWEGVRSVNDGKIYIVPRTNIVNHWGYIINQTWLDKLNLKAPTTLDEFTNVCKAFAQNDPDGNGKADTYCLSFSNPTLGSNTIWNASYFLASAFSLPIVSGAKDTDGNYKIKEKMSGYIPFLTYLKKLNDEKLIDPEFLVNKIYVDQDKLNQNRVGINIAHQYTVMANLSKDKDSDKKYTYHAPLKDSRGIASDWVTQATWGGWMIPKSSKNVDEALKFLDWGNTAEANTLFQIGIKGLTYDSYDPATKSISRTADQTTKLVSTTSTYMTIANAIDGEPALIENADTPERMKIYKTQLDEAMKQVTVINVPVVRSPKILNLSKSIPDLMKKKDEQEMQFILGKISEQQFKDFLEKEWYPATADAEKEYIEYMNKLGK